MAEIYTKRWDNPADPRDGTRILVCRYRPRVVVKSDETWHEWHAQLGPTQALHAAAYGKRGTQATWENYKRLYLKEMTAQTPLIDALAARVRNGETITLLCSSVCDRESRCHRSLLRQLILDRLADV